MQITQDVKKKRIFNTVVGRAVGSNLMIDLVIYDRFRMHNYQYILNCIDIKSRKAYGIALTKKDKETVTNALLKVFKEGYGGHVPEELQMDNGGEFTSEYFQNAMKKAGVKTLWYSEVGDIRKQSVIESFNKTLSQMLQKWREATGQKDWYKVLDRMYHLYNNSTHSTIKAKPNDVWSGKDINKQTITVITDKLKPGDRVRVKRTKKVFDKGDAVKFSREIYRVKEKKGQKWVIVDSKDVPLSRRYMEDELRLANKVEKSDIEVPNKTQVLNDQETERTKERRMNQLTNQLKNVGAPSKFDRDVSGLKGRQRVATKKTK